MKLVIQSKVGPVGRWKTVEVLDFEFNPMVRHTRSAVDIEREKNGGLLAQEAEVSYPRMKLHDKPIYRVRVMDKSGVAKL